MIRLVRFRSHSTKFFSREPLSYATFVARLDVLHKAVPRHEALLDCIRASRKLQARNSRASAVNDFLAISPSVSNQQLETILWDTIRGSLDEKLVRSYLTVRPMPTNGSNVVAAVSEIFKAKSDPGILRLGLATLLRNNDYTSCFDLIDKTVAAPEYVQTVRSKLQRQIAATAAAFGALNGLECYLLPSIPIQLTLFINTVASLGLIYAYWPLTSPRRLGRIGWRDSTSAIHTYTHAQELFSVSRVLMYYEEHNDINLKNYHLSKVRRTTEHSKTDDYIIESAGTRELVTQAHNSSSRWNDSLQKSLHRQLKNRKMVVYNLPEELQFIEYWMTQGADFEWIEPDQDPAEIVDLELYK